MPLKNLSLKMRVHYQYIMITAMHLTMMLSMMWPLVMIVPEVVSMGMANLQSPVVLPDLLMAPSEAAAPMLTSDSLPNSTDAVAKVSEWQDTCMEHDSTTKALEQSSNSLMEWQKVKDSTHISWAFETDKVEYMKKCHVANMPHSAMELVNQAKDSLEWISEQQQSSPSPQTSPVVSSCNPSSMTKDSEASMSSLSYISQMKDPSINSIMSGLNINNVDLNSSISDNVELGTSTMDNEPNTNNNENKGPSAICKYLLLGTFVLSATGAAASIMWCLLGHLM